MRSILILSLVALLVVSAAAAWAAEPTGPALNRGTQGWTTTYSEGVGGWGSWAGVYDGIDTVKGWKTTSVGGDQGAFSVKADVELFLSQTWDNTGVYFHKADINNPPPVVMPGTMTSNHGEWIGIAVAIDDNLFNLERKYNYRLGSVTKGDFNIGLEWRMRDSVGAGWSDWKEAGAIDSPGADNTVANAVWWLLGTNTPGSSAGAAGAYQYEFRCTAEMDDLQEAGRYELDPAMVVSPEL